MPEYRLRLWAEQTRYGSADYRVTADTLAHAAQLLSAARDAAVDTGTPQVHEGILAFDAAAAAPQAQSDDGSLETSEAHAVAEITPKYVVDVRDGMALIDAVGGLERDLVGVPVGASQLGRPLSAADDERPWHTGFPDLARADRDAVQHCLAAQVLTFGHARVVAIRTTDGYRPAGHDYRVRALTEPDGTAPETFVRAFQLATSLREDNETLVAVL